MEQLAEIENFISKDSTQRALTFVMSLISQAETLTQHPKKGRVVPELLNPAIREIIYKGYRIIYQLTPDTVQVLSVFEGHRQLRQTDTER
jgi:toxin ParE1/3/4